MQNTNSIGTVLSMLFVADVSIASMIGGAERVLYEASTRLARRGHAVKVLTRKLPYHESAVENINGERQLLYSKNGFLICAYRDITNRNRRI